MGISADGCGVEWNLEGAGRVGGNFEGGGRDDGNFVFSSQR